LGADTTAKLPLSWGRGLTLSDRFYTPTHPSNEREGWLMLSPFMERFGGQSPKVLASTKGARVIFYGTSRRLLTKDVCLQGPGDCPSHPLLVIYTLFDGPAEQLSPLCVWLAGRLVNQRPESKSRSLVARCGLSPTTVPTASSTARSRRHGTSTMTRSDRRSCSRQRTFDTPLRPI